MSIYLDRSKELRALETPHYNCAQGVLVPFAEKFGVNEEQAYKLTSNFAKGMKMGSVCGAVTGALMVLGLAGADDAQTVSTFLRTVRENHEGCLDCRDLLRKNTELGNDQKQHCDNMVFECLNLVEEILKARGAL